MACSRSGTPRSFRSSSIDEGRQVLRRLLLGAEWTSRVLTSGICRFIALLLKNGLRYVLVRGRRESYRAIFFLCAETFLPHAAPLINPPVSNRGKGLPSSRCSAGPPCEAFAHRFGVLCANP